MICNLFHMHLFVFILLLINFTDISIAENVKKSVDDNLEDNGEAGDDVKDSMEIPAEPEPTNATCTRRQNSRMHEIRSATPKQFPFMAAIMSLQNEYLCSGSVVSRGLILTSAKCTEQPGNYVLVNTISDKKDDTTVSLHIIRRDKFPSYTGSESSKDVGIIYTEKHNKSVSTKINLSNITDSKEVNDIEAFGFGLNADIGKTKELQYIGVEVRTSTDGDIAQAYIDCIETKVPTCFKDFGGPVMIDNQLFGIVIDGTTECATEITANYALNKRIIDILPTYTFKAWLGEKIRKNEEQESIVLETYPTLPVFRKAAHVKMTTGAAHFLVPEYAVICISALATIV